MKRLRSLRARLIAIILAPLLVIALIAGVWQYKATTQRAERIFDRGLLSAALAISRDISVSGGDALSPATRRLVNDTSGGELFYHAYAPDGVFVTGYSTPPVPPLPVPDDLAEPFYYNAVYQSQEVRVLRFQDATTVDGLTGIFNITVWQNADVRRSFVREVVSRSFGVIAGLVICVALVVWFGVGLGLRPLVDLEDAIAQRTSRDLEPIRRAVPAEAQRLVTTLNTLLDRVSRRISSKDEFISNAAHQLRNPVAGVLALAEAVHSAPTAQAAKERSAALLEAAREASALTNKLLSFERARGTDVASSGGRLELNTLVARVVAGFETQNPTVTVTHSMPQGQIHIHGDAVMLQEALLNLLTNAVVHGGAGLTEISLHLRADGDKAVLTVADDGTGIAADKHVQAISRFGQAGGGQGSGLGLPIAAKVMDNHGGLLEILPSGEGACIRLTFPLSADPRERCQ